MSDLQKERDREIISYFHDLDDIWQIILSKSIKILITENFEHFDIWEIFGYVKISGEKEIEN